MKLVFRVLVNKLAVFLVLSAASVVPAYSQQFELLPQLESTQQALLDSSSDLKPVTADGATAAAQTTAKPTSPEPYVFPTHRQRFKRFVSSTVGPFSLGRTAISAGVNQWRDHPEEWEQGASGFGKRFASSFGKHAIQQTVTYGLDEALNLDTGFRRSTRTGFGPRLKDALLENVTSRNRKGERVVAIPRFAGAYTSSIIRAETWYPARYDYKDGLRSGTTSILTGFAFNLIREFVIRR